MQVWLVIINYYNIIDILAMTHTALYMSALASAIKKPILIDYCSAGMTQRACASENTDMDMVTVSSFSDSFMLSWLVFLVDIWLNLTLFQR